jgi:hypothetical protein
MRPTVFVNRDAADDPGSSSTRRASVRLRGALWQARELIAGALLVAAGCADADDVPERQRRSQVANDAGFAAARRGDVALLRRAVPESKRQFLIVAGRVAGRALSHVAPHR